MADQTPTPDQDNPEEPTAAAQKPTADASAAGEAPARQAPVAEEALSEDAAPEAPAAPAEDPPAESKPKRRRKAKAVPARLSMTPQERQEHRDAQRARKAAVRRGRRLRERERARTRRQPSAAEELPSLHAAGTGQQKTRQGVVISDRAAKTITVRIDVSRRHPLYKKVVRTSTTLHAHDEQGDAHIGDTVIIKECRPLSRTKRWRLIEVVERAR
jgi:small subunit ribosomal protein S17